MAKKCRKHRRMCNGRFQKCVTDLPALSMVVVEISILVNYVYRYKSFSYLFKYNKISNKFGCYSIRRNCTSSLRLFWFMESKMSTITNE